MEWNKIKNTLMIGDFIDVEIENSLHCGFYCGIEENAHIPRIVLAGSHKFIHQSHEKQTYDHRFSIDVDKITDVWISNRWGKISKEIAEAREESEKNYPTKVNPGWVKDDVGRAIS